MSARDIRIALLQSRRELIDLLVELTGPIPEDELAALTDEDIDTLVADALERAEPKIEAAQVALLAALGLSVARYRETDRRTRGQLLADLRNILSAGIKDYRDSGGQRIALPDYGEVFQQSYSLLTEDLPPRSQAAGFEQIGWAWVPGSVATRHHEDHEPFHNEFARSRDEWPRQPGDHPRCVCVVLPVYRSN